MVEVFTESVTIGGRSYNKDKSGYPTLPTVFSGVEIVWGAPSCIEHPEPSRAQISLWVPKTHETFLPTLGEMVNIEAGIKDGALNSGPVSIFAGKVESVRLQDDHKPSLEPSRINHVINPSYETSTSPWTISGVTLSRTTAFPAMAGRVGDYIVQLAATGAATTGLMAHSNLPVTAGEWVGFSAWMATETGNYQTRLRIGFFNASGASLLTVDGPYSATPFYTGGTRQVIGQAPAGTTYAAVYLQFRDGNNPLVNIPAGKRMWADATLAVKGATQTQAQEQLNGGYFDGNTPAGPNTYYTWTGTAHASTSNQYNHIGATPGYRVNVVAADAVAEASRLRLSDEPWKSSGGMERLSKITELTAASGARFFDPGYTRHNGVYTMPAYVGGDVMEGVTVRARDVDSANALEVYQDTAMSAGLTVGSIDNVVTPNYKLLMPQVLDKNVSGAFVTEQTTGYSGRPIPVIPVGAIVDDTFTLDTTETVNQIKLSYFVREGTVWPEGESNAVKDATMSMYTLADTLVAPVTRSIKTENQVNDPYASLQPPRMDSVNAVVVRARAALAAQSVPRWRLSNGLSIVFKQMPYSTGLIDLIEEAGRFGQLIRIDGAPEQIEKYQRIRSGRIVLGEHPELEFQLEPVDYSGPTALTRQTAESDPITAAITIADLTNISSNDLRSIGAR